MKFTERKESAATDFSMVCVMMQAIYTKTENVLWTIVYILVHLSRRHTGELIGMVDLSRTSSSILFKHLLRNHGANQSQISYRASTGWKNESLFDRSWSHDQDSRHVVKIFKNLHRNQKADDIETWYAA